MSTRAANCSPGPALVPLEASQVAKSQRGHALSGHGQLPAAFHFRHVGEMQLLVVCHHHCTMTLRQLARELGSWYDMSKPEPRGDGFVGPKHCPPSPC